MTWVNEHRIVTTSSPDLATQPEFSLHGEFSLPGYIRENSFERRFHIWQSNGDIGWAVVLDIVDSCSWGQKFSTSPAFVYTTTGSKQNIHDMGNADLFAVHVLYK